jgi:hypothetical protein
MAVAHRKAGLLGEAVRDLGDLPEAHDVLAAAPDDDLLELARRLDAADQPDALVLQRAAHLADRRRRVVCTERIDHLGHRDRELAQLLGAQQHRQLALERTVDVDDRDAGDGAEAIGEVVLGEPRDRRVRLRGRRQREVHDRLRAGVAPRQNRLAHLQRQLVPHRADRVAHLVGGLDHVLVEVEDQHRLGAAFLGNGVEVIDACDRLHRLLDPVDQLALDRLG